VADAFDAGADDYITKQFRTNELVARLRSHMRRMTTHEDGRLLLDGVARIDFLDGMRILARLRCVSRAVTVVALRKVGGVNPRSNGHR
jgi:hypothetical protein